MHTTWASNSWPVATFVNYMHLLPKLHSILKGLVYHLPWFLHVWPRRSAHNVSCGPFPKMVGHPWQTHIRIDQNYLKALDKIWHLGVVVVYTTYCQIT